MGSPATQTIGGIDIGKIAGAVRERVGFEPIKAIAVEKNVDESEVSLLIGDMIKAVSAEPSGATIATISRAIGTKTETTQPIVDALVQEGVLMAEGTGARRKFTIKG